jgi:hypothetical protein
MINEHAGVLFARKRAEFPSKVRTLLEHRGGRGELVARQLGAAAVGTLKSIHNRIDQVAMDSKSAKWMKLNRG